MDLVSPLAEETNIGMSPLSKITLAYTLTKKDMDIEYISFLTALSPITRTDFSFSLLEVAGASNFHRPLN